MIYGCCILPWRYNVLDAVTDAPFEGLLLCTRVILTAVGALRTPPDCMNPKDIEL